MTRHFILGSGIAALVTRELDKWLQECGVSLLSKIKGRPVGQAVYKRLLNRFGVARYKVAKKCLYVLRDGSWKLVVHRDDVQAWLFGKKVEIRVGKEPDPSERGVKVRVGVMEATVRPGKDGKLGTKDDVTNIRPITPTTKIDGVVEWDRKKVDGKLKYVCEACGTQRSSKASIEKHITRDH